MVGLGWALAACGPNYARIDNELRARNLHLEQELDQARQTTKDQQATIEVLNEKLAQRLPRVETLPDARLKDLFTVGRVEIKGSTDAWDIHNDGKLEGFRVFVRPLMANGDVLPATGTLQIEAFDLAMAEGSQRIAECTYTPEQLKDKWYGGLGLNHFAVNCPWTKGPAHREITFKVRFIDALTGRAFTDQKVIDVHLAK